MTGPFSENQKIIAVDLPCFGNSDKSLDINYSKDNLANALDALMNKLGYHNYSGLGNSMGGEVALNLAYFHGDRLQSLILVDSAGNQENSSISLPPFLLENLFLSYIFQENFFMLSVYDKNLWDKDLFLKAYAYRFSSDISDSRLVTYHKCAHIPFVECEKQFINDVLEFLNSNEPNN